MSEQIDFLSAILLVSQNPDRLAQFYREIIGLPLKEEQHKNTEKHYGCELGDLHFAIHPVSNFKDQGHGTGSVKLAFQVFDLVRFVEKLANHQVKLAYPPKNTGFAIMTALTDPDGNYVEFTQLSDFWFQHLEQRREKGFDLIARSKRLTAFRLESERLILRLPTNDDIDEILKYQIENENHFAPYTPPRPEDFLTVKFWQDRIRKLELEWGAQRSIVFYLFDRNDNKSVIGSIEFSQILRGPFQACYLGYAISKKYEGNGFITEALRTSIKFIFEEKNIHRIMANHIPENIRSAKVLERLGFKKEGLAKEYLFIQGAWRDHVLNSLTNPNWKQA